MTSPAEYALDKEEAVRLVAGLVRRNEVGEAFLERRRVVSWTASESGLLAPSWSEEHGTAVRLRREGHMLLVAREGDGPESLREVVREAARRSGNTPFFKTKRAGERKPSGSEREPLPGESDEERSSILASALARSFADPRGLSVSLTISQVTLRRAVITPRAFLECGLRTHLEASGSVRREGYERSVAFQSSRPWSVGVDALSLALREASRPLSAVPPPSGPTDVVLAPGAAAVFWHEVLGHPLEDDGHETGSVLARVTGALVAPPGLDVVDDPGRTDLPGGYAVDDEGTVARPVPLLRDGSIAGILTDKRSGSSETNGHGRTPDFRRPPRPRMSNLLASAGRATTDELVALCENGLYIRDVCGGSADPESGRFVLLVESAESIRRGRRGGPVGRFALLGEILSALQSIEPEVGSEVLPATGLGLCIKAGDALPVGGAAASLVVRDLQVRTIRQ